MHQIIKTKITNGILTFPGFLRKEWQNKEVILFPERGRIIVQELQEGWDAYEEKLRRGNKEISSQLIDEAVGWAKRH